MSVTSEQVEFAKTVVTEMISRLGLTAEVSAMEREDDLVVKLDTPEPGRLIGRKGRTIDSLEYLVNRILGHHEQDFPRAVLDVDGHDTKEEGEREPRQRKPSQPRRDDSKEDERSQKLERLAQDAAKEVKRWGEVKSIGPYNSHDRRIVHLALDEDSEVVAETDTEAPEDAKMKKITIRLGEGGSQAEL